MQSYLDIQHELSQKQYDREFARKDQFTAWFGLYVTVLTILFALIYKSVTTNIEWAKVSMGAFYAVISMVVFLISFVAFYLGLCALRYFWKATKFREYKDLREAPEYVKWLGRYIEKQHINAEEQVDFLREVQIKALISNLGKAIIYNRKVNDERISELEQCRGLVIKGFVLVFFESVA